ncbi:hypothetical protein RA29_12090 [Tateyamaria sp. ANG-S1]|nr:hypothetical protein RA29_12090 [Tateyamaria sp. ANG-S1]
MAEAQFQQKRRRAWKKAPDEALGAVVSKRMNARKERFDAKRKRRMATQEFGKKLNDSDV